MRKSAGLTVMGAYAIVDKSEAAAFKAAAQAAAGVNDPLDDQPSYGAIDQPPARITGVPDRMAVAFLQSISRPHAGPAASLFLAGRTRLSSGEIYGVDRSGAYYATADDTFPLPFYSVVTAVVPQSPANEARSGYSFLLRHDDSWDIALTGAHIPHTIPTMQPLVMLALNSRDDRAPIFTEALETRAWGFSSHVCTPRLPAHSNSPQHTRPARVTPACLRRPPRRQQAHLPGEHPCALPRHHPLQPRLSAQPQLRRHGLRGVLRPHRGLHRQRPQHREGARER